MPKAGDVMNLVREAHATAYPKYGAIEGQGQDSAPPGTIFPGRTMKPLEIPKSILNS